MKKIIGVLLCLTLVMTVFVSCKNGKGESAGSQDSQISESGSGIGETGSSPGQPLPGERESGEKTEETSGDVSPAQTEREFTQDYEILAKGNDSAEEEEHP